MRNRTLADLDRVVALGGGHGLGRVSPHHFRLWVLV
ncbi:transferase with NAD(P)-binding Rossmann-fold domain; UPF0052 family [Escherichia coli]|uniref:Transferase with NAD(P)-binding Rossmann-fold domain UPF0052 family n=1 Tax=Escherichia coli TaxID=562 RepID=A0A376MV15_ECOLX|nr:transferase with NAD(P)-binding Rossmann-fold domain; UPF0052 family [Escherichia coli]